MAIVKLITAETVGLVIIHGCLNNNRKTTGHLRSDAGIFPMIRRYVGSLVNVSLHRFTDPPSTRVSSSFSGFSGMFLRLLDPWLFWLIHSLFAFPTSYFNSVILDVGPSRLVAAEKMLTTDGLDSPRAMHFCMDWLSVEAESRWIFVCGRARPR